MGIMDHQSGLLPKQTLIIMYYCQDHAWPGVLGFFCLLFYYHHQTFLSIAFAPLGVGFIQ